MVNFFKDEAQCSCCKGLSMACQLIVPIQQPSITRPVRDKDFSPKSPMDLLLRDGTETYLPSGSVEGTGGWRDAHLNPCCASSTEHDRRPALFPLGLGAEDRPRPAASRPPRQWRRARFHLSRPGWGHLNCGSPAARATADKQLPFYGLRPRVVVTPSFLSQKPTAPAISRLSTAPGTSSARAANGSA
jgi:hypothetical protein